MICRAVEDLSSSRKPKQTAEKVVGHVSNVPEWRCLGNWDAGFRPWGHVGNVPHVLPQHLFSRLRRRARAACDHGTHAFGLRLNEDVPDSAACSIMIPLIPGLSIRRRDPRALPPPPAQVLFCHAVPVVHLVRDGEHIGC